MPTAQRIRSAVKFFRRIGIAIAGSIVLLIGVAMIVLPGPAFIVIPIGLGILSLEFPWAERWRHKFHEHAEKFLKRIKDRWRNRRV